MFLIETWFCLAVFRVTKLTRTDIHLSRGNSTFWTQNGTQNSYFKVFVQTFSGVRRDKSAEQLCTCSVACVQRPYVLYKTSLKLLFFRANKKDGSLNVLTNIQLIKND